ncbi:MAG: HAMP domain-containing sensor histidine kinase [Bacillota bacterium]|nr:HAMP domain-containing sensor histidine kinase [Bacillota bacterium]
MLTWLNNRSQRRWMQLALLLLLVLLIACFLLARLGAQWFIQYQVRQDMALIGSLGMLPISDTAPGQTLADVWDHQMAARILDGQFNEESVAAGQTLLARYGMAAIDNSRYFSRYSPVFTVWFISLAGLSLSVWFCLTAVAFRQQAKIYASLRQLSEAALSASEHDQLTNTFFADADKQEGDLSALGRTLATLVERSGGRIRTIHADKQFLQTFLSDVSHQIKTPLSSLRLYHELILEEPGMAPERRQSFLQQGLDQIVRIEWLIQGLLKMARLEARAIPMQLQQADLAETIDSAIIPFTEQMNSQAVAVSRQVLSGLIVNHDPEWVAEALSNLIKNALEQMPDGGQLRIAAEASPLTIQLRISDTGKGLKTEEIPFIFERFYRSSTSPKENAVGIGLSLAKTILDQNGADLTAVSQPGSGATFVVTFIRR